MAQIDSSTPAYTAIASGATTTTTGSFTPPSSSAIFVSIAVAGVSAQSVSSITNSGTALTWAKRVASTSTGNQFGTDHPDAEIWWAYCTTSQAMTVTVNTAVAALASGGIVLPIVFTSVATSQTGNTGTASSNLTVSSYSAALTTSAAGSWVIGAFVDWDGVTPTPTTGQTLTVNGNSANDASTYIGQIYSAATASSGTSAPLSGTFATATGYVAAAVEVLTTPTLSQASFTPHRMPFGL